MCDKLLYLLSTICLQFPVFKKKKKVQEEEVVEQNFITSSKWKTTVLNLGKHYPGEISPQHSKCTA